MDSIFYVIAVCALGLIAYGLIALVGFTAFSIF